MDEKIAASGYLVVITDGTELAISDACDFA
jgi:hypothetical protein